MSDRNDSYTNKYNLEVIALAERLDSNHKASAQLGINEKYVNNVLLCLEGEHSGQKLKSR